MSAASQSVTLFLAARDFLLAHRDDYEKCYREFRWPELEAFNWAIDWFDRYAAGNDRPALWLVEEKGETRRSFQELSRRSSQVANFLRAQGLKRGDRILIMLPNALPIWETVLAAMKLGVVVVPTSTQASVHDLTDRITRGQVQWVLTDESGAEKCDSIPGAFGRCLIGDNQRAGWVAYRETAGASENFIPIGTTRADDPCFLYFTSGTTAKPKLVLHTHRSYPVGHLSTMFWVGVREGDTHQNISSPGWAKHAWSSFFAPWNAGATVFVLESPRFQPSLTLRWLQQARINTLCAPPTVWRFLILEKLGAKPAALRELVSAGEPLNPEVIAQVEAAWQLTIRDGFGQTETTAAVGNAVGQKVKPGSMGRSLPGYRVVLLDSQGKESNAGEVALALHPRPTGLMQGYLDDPERTARVMADGYYRTGDEATCDEEGYFHFVGRGDDVFKSSDYRISPFELESVLLEHSAVAEAAVIPSPDPIRLCVPKAVIVLKPGQSPTAETAQAIFTETNRKLSAYQRLRRIEFGELPKTISGKIRRVALREREARQVARGERGATEFWLHDPAVKPSSS